MRETHFIQQNKEKWQEFEQILENNYKDPEKLNKLFVEITDDLSYSRTFYRNRSVRVYLNGLAQRIFHNIYKTRKEGLNRFSLFWSDELPMLVYQARRDFLISFVVFFVAFLIGVVSSAMDIDFPRIILGDSYVDMTIANIESGDPMKVYKEKDALGMSLGITFNNLYVAFLTFIVGIFSAIGTIAILIQNGIMVGAFQYFFYEKGVFWESFLTIWTHGTLEIAAIIIAGAAGITMGKGILFPGTYSRMQSFQISAKRGLKIMIGITPIFIMAGFIEGFFTRFTETPDFIRLMFILVCLIFILFYFGWYPRVKAKSGFKTKVKKNELPPNKDRVIYFDKIKSIGELFSDVFIFYQQHFKVFFSVAVLSAVLFSLFVGLSHIGQLEDVFIKDFFSQSHTRIPYYFNNSSLVLLPFFNIVIYSLLAFIVFQKVDQNSQMSLKTTPNILLDFIKVAIPIGLMQLITMVESPFNILVAIFFFPPLLLWAFVAYRERVNVPAAAGKAINLLATDISTTIGLSATLILLSLLFHQIVNTSVFRIILDFISWNFPFEGESRDHLIIYLAVWSAVLLLYMLSILLFIGMSLLYFSFLEILEAQQLRKQIANIGLSQKIKGIDKEF